MANLSDKVTPTGVLTPNGDGSGLTSLTSANLTGALPAVSGAALTNLPIPSGDYTVKINNTSGTFTATLDETIIIQAVGGGGSGAATQAAVGGVATGRAWAQGGASGGYVAKTVDVQVGDTISWVIGAGGVRAQVNATGPGSVANGSAGSSTTVTGSNLGSGNVNISLTAGGGGGGKGSATANSPPAIVSGGAAGTGGDIGIEGNPTRNDDGGVLVSTEFGVAGAYPRLDSVNPAAYGLFQNITGETISNETNAVQTPSPYSVVLSNIDRPVVTQGLTGRKASGASFLYAENQDDATQASMGSGGAAIRVENANDSGMYLYTGQGGNGFVAIAQKRSV